MNRCFTAAAAATLLVLATVPSALARADAYYTVVCDDVAYESVDARAVDQGGKDDAVAWFGEKHETVCQLAGPFSE